MLGTRVFIVSKSAAPRKRKCVFFTEIIEYKGLIFTRKTIYTVNFSRKLFDELLVLFLLCRLFNIFHKDLSYVVFPWLCIFLNLDITDSCTLTELHPLHFLLCQFFWNCELV